MVLISSIFTGAKTVHDRYSLAYVDSPKCSYYALMRFVSDSRYNWALLLRLIAKVAVSIIMKLNDKEHIYTLCIDDTIVERARGKHIEGLSRTFDHVKGKCVKGFANLLIGWSDGLNIFSVISALVNSRKDALVIRDFDKKVDKKKQVEDAELILRTVKQLYFTLLQIYPQFRYQGSICSYGHLVLFKQSY